MFSFKSEDDFKSLIRLEWVSICTLEQRAQGVGVAQGQSIAGVLGVLCSVNTQ